MLSLAGTFAVRQVLRSAFTRVTGRTPPGSKDAAESLGTLVLWAVVSTAAIATMNVVIDHVTAGWAGEEPAPSDD